MTDCLVELNVDGSTTEETDLQHWPRFASLPKRLRINHLYSPVEPFLDSPLKLVQFLRQCMQQEHAIRLLKGVQALEVRSTGRPYCKNTLMPHDPDFALDWQQLGAAIRQS